MYTRSKVYILYSFCSPLVLLSHSINTIQGSIFSSSDMKETLLKIWTEKIPPPFIPFTSLTCSKKFSPWKFSDNGTRTSFIYTVFKLFLLTFFLLSDFKPVIFLFYNFVTKNKETKLRHFSFTSAYYNGLQETTNASDNFNSLTKLTIK